MCRIPYVPGKPATTYELRNDCIDAVRGEQAFGEDTNPLPCEWRKGINPDRWRARVPGTFDWSWATAAPEAPPDPAIDAPNSVVGRLVALLAYLDAEAPGGRRSYWSRHYLRSAPGCSPYAPPAAAGAQELVTERVTLIGSSQGAGLAAFMGRFLRLARVITVVNPSDQVFTSAPTGIPDPGEPGPGPYCGRLADWIAGTGPWSAAPRATPPTAYFGLDQRYDYLFACDTTGDLPPGQVPAYPGAWNLLGYEPGSRDHPVDPTVVQLGVEPPAPPGTHQLVSDLTPQTPLPAGWRYWQDAKGRVHRGTCGIHDPSGPGGTSHTCLDKDSDTPIVVDAQGHVTPLFAAVWSYLLTAT
jgi:hypothetical protein